MSEILSSYNTLERLMGTNDLLKTQQDHLCEDCCVCSSMYEGNIVRSIVHNCKYACAP